MPSWCDRPLTVSTSRRLIGRRFDDPTVKKDMESWPFKVVDDDGSPKVEVQYLGSTHTFSPQEISAMVLTKVSSPRKPLFMVWPNTDAIRNR